MKPRKPMKRAAIKKTRSPLKRRAPMRKRSKKKEKEIRETSPARKLYREAHPECQVCQSNPTTEVHEIARGGCRQRSVRDADCWLAVCHECHERLGDYSWWPIEKQVALKCRRTIESVNEVRSGLRQLTYKDVGRWMCAGILSWTEE